MRRTEVAILWSIYSRRSSPEPTAKILQIGILGVFGKFEKNKQAMACHPKRPIVSSSDDLWDSRP